MHLARTDISPHTELNPSSQRGGLPSKSSANQIPSLLRAENPEEIERPREEKISAHADRGPHFAWPPIDMSGNFSVHVSAEIHLQTSPPIPQKSYPTGKLLKIPPFSQNCRGRRGHQIFLFYLNPNICVT